MDFEQKPVVLVTQEEESRITRSVLIWLNTFPEKPVKIISYGLLEADKPSMALEVIRSAITKRYIVGGHQAEYQFGLNYRVKSNNSPDESLKADELLDRLGDWAGMQNPDLGEGISVQRVETTARATLTGYYDNHDENHQILMKITYEVI